MPTRPKEVHREPLLLLLLLLLLFLLGLGVSLERVGLRLRTKGTTRLGPRN